MRGLLLSISILLALQACSEVKKIGEMNSGRLASTLVPSDDIAPQELGLEAFCIDTAKVVEVFGEEMFVMEEGEKIAPSIKIASFRNVAERHGRVELRFRIGVPEEMIHGKFQVRLHPAIRISGDSIPIESLLFTGEAYRKFQLRGYQRYERFLQSIVTDTTLFVRTHDLEVFLHRNLPKLYELKRDTSLVSEEVFESIFGVDEMEAVDHYTNKFLKNANERRKEMKDIRFRRYVKSPFLTEGIRLDTVIKASDGRMEYEYVQSIAATPSLRKAEVFVDGEVWEPGRKVYDIPKSGPLTFYISTLSSLVDPTPRYRIKVVSRYVHESSSYTVLFEKGSSELRRDLADNGSQLDKIMCRLEDLASDVEYDVDSVKVTSSASPEGSWTLNGRLSAKRGETICRYFEKVWPLRYGVLAENWPLLSEKVAKDPYLNSAEIEEVAFLISSCHDKDSIEMALAAKPYYNYLKEVIYPGLRLVRMDFYLRRKDMVQDTVHTMELDTAYMAAVQKIRDRDYKSALPVLKDAADFNAAILYASLDLNDSALYVLNSLDETANVLYLKAVVLTRKGNEKEALEKYLEACKADRSYIHRGNLDPEISSIIKKFKIKTNLL